MCNLASESPCGAVACAGADGLPWAILSALASASDSVGEFSVGSPGRFRYSVVRLEYVYLGTGAGLFTPAMVILVHTGRSVFEGLAHAPVLFQDESAGQPVRLAEVPITVEIGRCVRRLGIFVYEFPAECREFRLYFPGCEGLPLSVG